MKKLIAILSIVLFLIVGCQDSSSIVAPDNETNVETQDQFVPSDVDDSGSQDSQDPGYPRI